MTPLAAQKCECLLESAPPHTEAENDPIWREQVGYMKFCNLEGVNAALKLGSLTRAKKCQKNTPESKAQIYQGAALPVHFRQAYPYHLRDWRNNPSRMDNEAVHLERLYVSTTR